MKFHTTLLQPEGRTITGIEIPPDTAPRTVDLPEDFAAALDAAGLRPAFDKLAPSHRKEHVRAIEEAKTPETRTPPHRKGGCPKSAARDPSNR
ncbi:MAG: YdeI/OmpD-associated family protein [Asticcacaulis sp.]